MEQEFIIKKLIEASEQLLHLKLDENAANEILSLSQVRMYKKGDTIVGINEKLIYVGFVLKGIVRSYYLDSNGNEITKNFHKEYFMFMDEGLIGYEKSLCAYETLEDSNILFWEIRKLKELIKKNEKFKDLYIAALESGIRYKIYREREFLMNNATERYLQFKKDYPELVNRVKQTYISTYLRIAPESLSRIRKALKEVTDTEGEIYE